MESKYENQLSLLNKIKENSKRSYVSKMNYLSLISGKIDTVFKYIDPTSKAEVARTVIFDKEINSIYSYSIMHQIKETLKTFKYNRKTFRETIRGVIINWKKPEQVMLAENFVN